MIAKITGGSKAGGCANYDINHSNAEILYADGLNISHEDMDMLKVLNAEPELSGQLKEAANIISSNIEKGFNAQARLNPKVELPVKHLSINFKPEDAPKLSNQQLVKIGIDYMQSMGFLEELPDGDAGERWNTQFMISKHDMENHPHIHIMFNTVDVNGNKIDTSFERLKNINVCKELNRKYELTVSSGKEMTDISRLKGFDKIKYEMVRDIKEALKQSCDLPSFQKNLKPFGINCKVHTENDSNKIKGISFGKYNPSTGKTFVCKGSKLDKDLSAPAICQELENNQSNTIKNILHTADEILMGLCNDSGKSHEKDMNPEEDEQKMKMQRMKMRR